MRRFSIAFVALVLLPTLARAQSAPAAPAPDSFQVYASHREPKPTDPVTLTFERVTVKKAKFDPKKIEGGTAEIEVDLTSLKTNSAKRDGHLKSPDYLDVGKYATLTIAIGNVKKKGDKTFTADATVKIKELTTKFPVTFEVVETLPDGIRVKGEHAFTRKAVGIGKDEGDIVGQDLKVALQLTLKPTK